MGIGGKGAKLTKENFEIQIGDEQTIADLQLILDYAKHKIFIDIENNIGESFVITGYQPKDVLKILFDTYPKISSDTQFEKKETKNLKTQYHLLLNCPNALESVAKVMQNGNEKGRTELDWKERTKEYFKEKAIRHIFEAETNEIDEDGESHYSHAIANLLFMLEIK